MPFKVDLNDLSLEQVPIEEKTAQTQPARSNAGKSIYFFAHLALYFSLILDINTLYIMPISRPILYLYMIYLSILYITIKLCIYSLYVIHI